MANHPSALKRMRQNEKRRLRNMSFRSKTRTVVKRFLKAVDEKDPSAAELLSAAMSLMQKGVSKGIFHRNTTARTVSRLAKRLPPS
ncbi:MAG: 30S ribosomal protein S20 [Deltaproteobacteria bacterium]|nr:30S ribosomal protein S20 [Deltaproteobacteria bacterium]